MIGPLGVRARPHPWWTPVRLLLAVAVVMGALCLVQKAPCVVGGSKAAWWHSPHEYAKLCASGLPAAYTSTGLAEGVLPLSSSDGRFPVPAESAPTAVLAYGAASLSRALHGWPSGSDRAGESIETVAGSKAVREEAVTYVAISAAIQVLALLIALRCLAGTITRRLSPYRRLIPFAASPLLIFAGLVGWDLVPVALTCAALWAWDRQREILTGVLLGIAIAMSVWPVVVLVTMVGTYVRTDRERTAWRAAGAALIAWVAINLPAFVLSSGNAGEYLGSFFGLTAGEGSLWRVLQIGGVHLSADTTSAFVLAAWALLAVAAFAYAATYRDPGRLARVTFVLLVGVLVVGKSYEPGHALWLLPLAVLAHRDWRDLLIWQGAELLSIVGLWWHLGTYTLGVGNHDNIYPIFILIRIVAELWLAYRVMTAPLGHAEPVTPAPKYSPAL